MLAAIWGSSDDDSTRTSPDACAESAAAEEVEEGASPEAEEAVVRRATAAAAARTAAEFAAPAAKPKPGSCVAALAAAVVRGVEPEKLQGRRQGAGGACKDLSAPGDEERRLRAFKQGLRNEEQCHWRCIGTAPPIPWVKR